MHERRSMTEQQPTCGVGGETDHPCTNPAAKRPWGDSGPRVCEGHERVFELGEEEDDLRESLDHLERWIRTADRYGVGPLRRELRTLRDGFAAELGGIEAKEREISERYSLPPSAPEQPEAKKPDETPVYEPRTEGERRFHEHNRRAARFVAAAVSLEEEIDKLHMRLEEAVLPLLEEEAGKAGEDAERVKAEFGL
jgi:hypothetical protein